MYERFTDRARKVMALANQEAQRFNHEYIGTEHILLGLAKEGGGVGANVLRYFDVDLRKLRLEVERLVKSAPEIIAMGKLPQTPRARKTLDYAAEEARKLNHNYVGTEHLLLGLIREHEGIAAQILRNLGLQLEEVRKEVLNLLGAAIEETEELEEEFGKKGEARPGPSLNALSDAEELDPELVALSEAIQRLNLLRDEAERNAEYERAAGIGGEAETLYREQEQLRDRIRRDRQSGSREKREAVFCCTAIAPLAEQCVRVKEVNDAAEKLRRGCQIVLIGPPGCGCSTALGAIAHQLSHRDRAYQMMTLLTPDFEKVRAQINDKGSEVVFELLRNCFVPDTRNILALRGLEVVADLAYSKSEEREGWKQLIMEIQSNGRPLLVTAREKGWQAISNQWPGLMQKFEKIVLGPLTRIQFREVVTAQLNARSTDVAGEMVLHRNAMEELVNCLPEEYPRYPFQAVCIVDVILKLLRRKTKGSELHIDKRVIASVLKEIQNGHVG